MQADDAAETKQLLSLEQDVKAHGGLLTVDSAARQSEKFSSATGTLSPLRPSNSQSAEAHAETGTMPLNSATFKFVDPAFSADGSHGQVTSACIAMTCITSLAEDRGLCAHPDVVQRLQQERLLVEVERHQVPASKLRMRRAVPSGLNARCTLERVHQLLQESDAMWLLIAILGQCCVECVNQMRTAMMAHLNRKLQDAQDTRILSHSI